MSSPPGRQVLRALFPRTSRGFPYPEESQLRVAELLAQWRYFGSAGVDCAFTHDQPTRYASPMTLARTQFPRSSAFDDEWVFDHQMGPNPLWLTEWLCAALELEAGMKVLDLGCGKALSSIFLAREVGARVFAADLWMSPEHNLERALQAGVGDLVFPLKAEAHSLPFAESFFDAAISIDAYHYFGTDELYLHYLATRVRPGGQLGVVVPGLVREFEDGVPQHLTAPQKNGKAFWEPACWSFKTADFWRQLWRRCPLVEEVRCELLEDGWRHWRDFEIALTEAGKNPFPSDAEALNEDAGRYLGFLRVVATRSEETGLSLYDPDLGRRVGVDG